MSKVEFGAGRRVDLSQLSEAERRVLRLLAQGHTAKSIAVALGSSPTAINERLRQARRKTGAGSSREVARLLTAQENRHEKIEVAADSTEEFQESRARTGRARRSRFGVVVMIIVIAAVLSVASFVAEQPSPVSNKSGPVISDPIVGVVPSSEFDIAQLYSRLRTEQRDVNWAPRTEEKLRGYISSIRYVGGTTNPLRITCGTYLCEAAGVIDAPATRGDESSMKSPINHTMQALQGKAIHDFATSLGLDDVAASFQGSPIKHAGPSFLVYFQRKRFGSATPNAPMGR